MNSNYISLTSTKLIKSELAIEGFKAIGLNSKRMIV